VHYKIALALSLLAACGDNHASPGLDAPKPPAPDSALVDAPPPTPTVKMTKTKLVGDEAGGANTDPNLVNAWGIAFAPTGAIWVAANHTGKATVYSAAGVPAALVVSIPVPAGVTDDPAPTGQVFNGTAADFMGDKFILSTENGTVVGWQTGTTAAIRVDRSAAGANYKGLDILDAGVDGRVILGANFSLGTVSVWNKAYAPITLDGGAFVDPSLPAGYAPFNVMVSGTNVYVAYAMQDAEKHDDVSGPGIGAISVFDNTGKFVRRLVTGGDLNSPWAMAIAPADFPQAASGDLIVGNFGDGAIHAYDPTTGEKRANIVDATGAPLQIPFLWALTFGKDAPNESHLSLFYTAGPAGETHGALGRLDLAP